MRLLPCFTVLTLLAGCRTTEDIQRDYAHRLAPSSFRSSAASTPQEGSPEGAPPAHVRHLRVRAYLDEEFRAQILRPEERVRQQVQRASEALAQGFGVQLDLVELKPWSHRGSEKPEQLIEALARLDPGEDVDWVIGFISALPVFSSTMDQLGAAQLYGRHAVLRGMENAEELDAITRALDKLPAGEREHLYRELKLHKETAVLLHELGHSLGAWHVTSPDYLMCANYDRHQVAFAPEAAEAIQIGLRHYPAGTRPGPKREAWAQELRALAEQRKGAWRPEGLEQVAAFAEAAKGGRPMGGEDPRNALSREDVDAYNRAVAATQAGDSLKARALAVPLAARNPQNADVSGLLCMIVANEPAPDDAARAQCRTAAELPGQRQRASVLMALGRIELQAKDTPGAVATLKQASAELAAKSDAPSGQWLHLAGLFAEAHALSAAEDALEHAGEGGKPLAAKIISMRRWLGVPRAKAPVDPDVESSLVLALKAAQGDVEGVRLDRARQRIDSLLRAHPKSPGALTLRCIERGRRGDLAGARKACEAALAAQADCLQAEMLLVQMEKDPKAEQRRLEHVIALEPSYEVAWKRLAVVLQETGAKEQAAQLKTRYRAQFGRELAF